MHLPCFGLLLSHFRLSTQLVISLANATRCRGTRRDSCCHSHQRCRTRLPSIQLPFTRIRWKIGVLFSGFINPFISVPISTISVVFRLLKREEDSKNPPRSGRRQHVRWRKAWPTTECIQVILTRFGSPFDPFNFFQIFFYEIIIISI